MQRGRTAQEEYVIPLIPACKHAEDGQLRPSRRGGVSMSRPLFSTHAANLQRLLSNF
jgi:hypothetical protein